MTALGERIRELRRDAGLSLRALAAPVGISATYLYDIEQGMRQPSHDVLAGIEMSLGVKPGELQALDLRLPAEYAECFRLAVLGDWDATLDQVAALENWQLEKLRNGADVLATAAAEILGRRNS